MPTRRYFYLRSRLPTTIDDDAPYGARPYFDGDDEHEGEDPNQVYWELPTFYSRYMDGLHLADNHPHYAEFARLVTLLDEHEAAVAAHDVVRRPVLDQVRAQIAKARTLDALIAVWPEAAGARPLLEAPGEIPPRQQAVAERAYRFRPVEAVPGS